MYIVIRKHKVVLARVGVDGKHECPWVLGVVEAQGVAKLVGSNKEQVVAYKQSDDEKARQ